MRIKKLMIEDFGRFHRKTFMVSDGLNVATGENESGKTTLRYFLMAMWYGLERERGRKANNDDYTRYKPWESGRFCGSMEFEADGETYLLSRDFLSKKVTLLRLRDGYEVERPELFLQKLGLPAQTVYRNAFWIGNECRTEEELAVSYRNHVANVTHTGGMNLDLGKAKERLKRQKRELEKQLPERELAECMECAAKKKELSDRLWKETEQLHLLEKRCREAERQLEAAQEKLKEAEQELKNQEQKQNLRMRRQKRVLVGTAVSVVLWVLCDILCRFRMPQAELPVLLLGFLFIAAWTGIGLWKVRKEVSGTGTDPEERCFVLRQEIRENYEQITRLSPGLEKSRFFMEQLEEQLKNCETAEARYLSLRERTEELEGQIQAVVLAQETIDKVAEKLYRECGETFYQKLSEYAAGFTDRAYERLVADEHLGLRAITGSGSVEVADVSYGTGEQFYLALRLAAADVFDPEKRNPLILDDSFAAFDDKRLESALLRLANVGRQVIIFSSTGREEHALQRMGVAYEKVFKEAGQSFVERN